MIAKRLCVLANSIKKRMRCVAGRELVTYPDGKSDWGGWIRPVTTHDEGAIGVIECLVQGNCIPEPFDVIEVPCIACDNDPIQPENWKIQEGSQWIKLFSFNYEELLKLVENPPNLWLENGVRQDRVSSKYILSLSNHQSLYIIKPVNFRFFVETNPMRGNKRVRALFQYNGYNYDFSMTDPLISQKYFPNLSAFKDGPVRLNDSENCYICVSLTPEFQGFHYKIVATVFEQ